MRLAGLLALLLVGCGPAAAIIDDSDPNADDTGNPGDDGDPNTDDTGNADTGSTADEPDLSAWVGTRTFTFDDLYGQGPCEDEVEESGENVGDDIDYTGAFEACPDCEAIFAVDVSPATLCEEQTAGQGLPVATEVIRGVEFIGARDVRVYAIRYSQWQGWSAEEMADGTLDGVELTYDYEGEVYGAQFTAKGIVDFD